MVVELVVGGIGEDGEDGGDMGGEWGMMEEWWS